MNTTPLVARSGGRSRRVRLTALVAASVLLVPALPAAASPDPVVTQPLSVPAGGPAAGVPAAGAGEGTRVTLITGDVIVYRDHSGEPTFTVEEASRGGRPAVLFESHGDRENFYVYPSDVAGHIAVGALDEELFNVAGLIRRGLTGGTTAGELPVLVTFEQDRDPSRLERDANALPAASGAQAVEAQNGAAVAVELPSGHEFMDAVLGAPVRGGERFDLGHGLAQVRLDQQADPDETAGAFTAPGSGHTGGGVFDGGALTAGNGVAPRTAPGVEAEEHTLTVQVLDSQGEPYLPPPTSFGGQTVRAINDTFEPGVGDRSYRLLIDDSGIASGQVPTGTYTLISNIAEVNEEADEYIWAAFLIEMEMEVSSDVTTTLDTREAVELTVSVPQKVRERTQTITLSRRPGVDITGPAGDIPYYVTPAPPGQLAPISMFTHWTLAEPQPLHSVAIYNFGAGNHNRLYSETPAYVYNLAFGYENGIPDDLHHEVTHRDLVKVPTRYHADDTDIFVEHHFEAHPPFDSSLWFERFVIKPGPVTEYFLADGEIGWNKIVTLHTRLEAPAPGSMNMFGLDRFMDSEAGGSREEERWWEAPLRYGAVDVREQQRPPEATSLAAFSRAGPDGDHFNAGLLAMDNGRGHGGIAAGPDAFGFWRMWNLDTGVELDPTVGFRFPLAPGEAAYRLELSWSYPPFVGGLFQTKPASTTTWTFHSETATGEVPTGYECPMAPRTQCEFQPLIQLRYGFDLDIHNRAQAGEAHVVTVEAGSHSKAPDRAPVTEMVLEYSTDGGGSWTEAEAAGGLDDGIGRFLVEHPRLVATDGYVAIRASARDADGNTVEETIERAYILR